MHMLRYFAIRSFLRPQIRFWETISVRNRVGGCQVNSTRFQTKFEKQITKMAAHKHGIPVSVKLCGETEPQEINLVIRKKKARRMTVDKERNVVLAAALFPYISDIVTSGELGNEFSDLSIKLTRMEVAPNFSALHVFWFDETGDVDATTEAAMGPKLNALGVVLREKLTEAAVLPSIPPVIFKLDRPEQQQRRFEEALASIDLGPDHVPTEAPIAPPQAPFKPEPTSERPWMRKKSLDSKCDTVS